VLASFPTSIFGAMLHRKLKERNNPDGIYPEGRLIPAIFASILAPIGVFWFAWSSFSNVHWMVPISSGVIFGWSIITLMICLFGYLTDIYHHVGASLLAASTLTRSTFAFAFPLFMPKLYENLHAHWAGTILGSLLLLFMPVPLLFWQFGERIRARSTFKFRDSGR